MTIFIIHAVFMLFMEPWIHKYMPKSSKEIEGQANVLRMIKEFILNYKDSKKNALLLYGAPGLGKTSSVNAVAKDLDYELIEMNASDYRNKDKINSILGNASQQMSLFSKGKIILVDEVDGVAGRKDFGGVASIIALIKKSKFPIIMTANNPFHKKFSTLRKKAEMVQLKELDINSMLNILKKICDSENVKYSEDVLKTLARRSGGDARSAINDLQTVSSNGTVDKKNLDNLGDRDKTSTMLTALKRILKAKDLSVSLGAFDNVNENIDECILWLDENIAYDYKNPKDLARAYDKLSRADVFRGRIRRWQHWRFLSYVNQLCTAGVAVAKDERNKDFVAYKPTGRILKMWWAKQKNMKKKSIAEKIAYKTHCSMKEAFKHVDYYKKMFENPDLAFSISEEIELNKDEIEWMKK